jgi:phosphoglycolate phosphatase-like HAD superfamily hydrolase
VSRRSVAVLDVDGTLIDSNDAHARAWVETAAEIGHEVAFEEVRRLIGMGGDRVLPALTGLDEDSPEGERVSERRGELFRERYLAGLSPFPGVRALLERLRDDGYRLVVASSAGEDDLAKLLERAGVADLIEERTSSTDAESSKPAPDIVEAALRSADVGADDAIMLGDTPYDVEASLRAGVPIVAVRSGGWDDRALRGAAAVYEDAAELLRRYDGSPFARE